MVNSQADQKAGIRIRKEMDNAFCLVSNVMWACNFIKTRLSWPRNDFPLVCFILPGPWCTKFGPGVILLPSPGKGKKSATCRCHPLQGGGKKRAPCGQRMQAPRRRRLGILGERLSRQGNRAHARQRLSSAGAAHLGRAQRRRLIGPAAASPPHTDSLELASSSFGCHLS